MIVAKCSSWQSRSRPVAKGFGVYRVWGLCSFNIPLWGGDPEPFLGSDRVPNGP